MSCIFDEFVTICEKTCSADEFKSKKRRTEHNAAMTSLEKLKKKMFVEQEHCLSIAVALMQHDNEKVRINAAAYCLEANISVETAKQVLLDIYRNSSDRILSYNAYWTMMLPPRQWR